MASFIAYGAVAAAVSAPIAAERAVEGARFDDRIGSVPVEISLAHNGVSTLDTGVLGSLYWERTGAMGFGARLRVTGTPEAGGSLASYVDPRFLRANAAFVSDPDTVAQAYGDELRARFWRRFLQLELAAFAVGGILFTAIFRARAPFPGRLRRRTAVATGAVVITAACLASAGSATLLFKTWEGNAEPPQSYPLPGVDGLSFSSPQALEVARQLRPFVEKNTARLRERASRYEANSEAALRRELSRRAGDLVPRTGERIVIAEADPQGSLVATSARTTMYALLREELGDDSFVMRTISGDVTSNGTVAEAEFVDGEVAASAPIPTVAIKGDHDTDTTVEQLLANDVINPNLTVEDVDGLTVAGANDPAFKALFGGLVVNESGVTEAEVGAELRDVVDEEDLEDSVIVLLHQPRSVAGYLGIDSTDDLDQTVDQRTSPRDDGIPDVPPGIINVGHLHDAAPPKVIWNTDGDRITWTVVNQLGTSGGVEESPTFNRFSTPFSVPLKPVSVQLQYVDTATGLQTGYATIEIDTEGAVTVSARTDLGIPRETPSD